MTKSKIFLYFCLSFIGGIFLSSIFIPHLLIIGGGLILGILLISIFWQYKKFVVIGFCILFLVAGICRYQQTESRITNNELKNFNDQEEITLIGQVVKEPDIRENNIKLTVKPEKIDGKVLVTVNRYPEYQYGDKLKITGELKTPQVFKESEGDKSSSSSFTVAQDFNYKNYLAKDGIYSVIYWPQIKLIEKKQGNFVYSKILDFKNKLRESIYQNLSPPQSSILGAIILGDKRKISEEWKNKLNISGVRHLTAISGMHVAILTAILMTLLIGLGLWRQQAFYFTIILIAFFIVMTGLQPSAIRAGIMGGLFLLAQYLGRMNVSSQAIVFAAAVMLVQNPLLLKLDVGFQLSFLAMMGIIYLFPIFQKWIQGWFKKIPNTLNFKDILSLTLAAQIFTLPILIFNFGYFSQIAPLTNILIVPFLPYIMVLGFISGLFGMIFQPLGWILSWPAWLLLTYITKIVAWFSQIPWAAKALEVSWVWLIISYLILGLIAWRLQESQKLKFLKY